jgi:hypothetical protein
MPAAAPALEPDRPSQLLYAALQQKLPVPRSEKWKPLDIRVGVGLSPKARSLLSRSSVARDGVHSRRRQCHRNVRITVFFSDREPAGPYFVSIAARRTLQLRPRAILPQLPGTSAICVIYKQLRCAAAKLGNNIPPHGLMLRRVVEVRSERRCRFQSCRACQAR